MRSSIERALCELVGEPLRYVSRAANMPTVGFGLAHLVPDNRKGGLRAVATWRLHVGCACRLVGRNGIVAGWGDIFFAAGDDPHAHRFNDAWDYSQLGANRWDECTAAWYAGFGGRPPVVEDVEADGLGGCRLRLSGGWIIELWPDDSLPDEYWRFFRFDAEEHFVVTGQGIGDGDE